LPAQVAAVNALQDPDYYVARYEETQALRARLAMGLVQLGLEVLPGVGNFILAHLPEKGPVAATIVKRCIEDGVFLRDARLMGAQMGDRAVRIAVRDCASNERIVAAMKKALAAKS
jgi:histidinol-phosphate/aromatic aminotransferase/cobyric acid decarboxylase-like protein